MESPRSPPGSVRRHGRNISQPLVRRSTRGPLDAPDNPLDQPTASPIAELASPTTSSEEDRPPASTQASALSQKPKPNIDMRFLQDPANYHSLPTEDIAPPFLSSDQQPPPDTPLAELLNRGHFRRAAETAVTDLLQCQSDDPEQILQLLYTRLACLVLISRQDLAAQEAAPLTDMLARSPPSATDLVALIPWELRLVLVRLQSVATTDGGRRGIMALYALAGEARARQRQAHASGNKPEQDVWAERLRDLGLRVADALVEMGELETANRHLDGLSDVDADQVVYRKAMLRLRVGDVAGAQGFVDKLDHDSRKATLEVLLKIADGKDAVASWQSLLEEHPDDALLANNLAVSMLYAGRITDARDLLQSTLNRSAAFTSILFNISTIYELCSERAVDHKMELTQTIAEKVPTAASGGWERAGFDFKL
ncbi:hypothetical protein LTR56_013703 [Elasticomyces elasticus]|nr:hypothetical protein LTR56_013703 [Elasticomyces elasticus]KAK3668475.1 hypothetical protein LTR22_000768 [Elasticomyces elasticus]KAK4930836.1 hypothetical protein LTR49_002601 [Elasticomyces elasticus]KAK5753713.1 hypothetical protein LTS12_016238 [Elasticomyces elasticus]